MQAQVKGDQVSPLEPKDVSESLDEGNSQVSEGERNDTGRRNATEKTVGSEGSETADLLREHLPASLILEYATFLITVVTVVFAVFLAAFGYFEWARFKKLQEEIARERDTLDQRNRELREEVEQEKQALDKSIQSFKLDLENQRSELAEERQALHVRVETFKGDLKEQEQRLVAYQRFLEAVLSNHSDLLVGVIEGFRSALSPEEDRRLRSLVSEAEAVLDLFHPDKEEVSKALMRLEQIGADSAVPSLVRLRGDSVADGDIRVKAQVVLGKIQERLKEERKKAIVQPLGAQPRIPPQDQAG